MIIISLIILIGEKVANACQLSHYSSFSLIEPFVANATRAILKYVIFRLSWNKYWPETNLSNRKESWPDSLRRNKRY